MTNGKLAVTVIGLLFYTVPSHHTKITILFSKDILLYSGQMLFGLLQTFFQCITLQLEGYIAIIFYINKPICTFYL